MRRLSFTILSFSTLAAALPGCSSPADPGATVSGGSSGAGGDSAGGQSTGGAGPAGGQGTGGASGGSGPSGGSTGALGGSGGTAAGGGAAGTSGSGGAASGGTAGGGGAAGSPAGGGGSSGGVGASSGGASGGAAGGGGNASGGGGGFSTDPGDFLLGGDSTCPGSFAVCESFEATSAGQLPSGWTSEGYGERTLAVSESMAARGSRALQVDVDAGQAAVVAMLQMSLPEPLSAAHFGRMFYRVEGPGASEFVHFDMMEGTGPWEGHENAVRLASTGTMVGTEPSNWSFIYNVQPFGDGAGAEFGTEGERAAHPRVDDWMCLEWSFDSDAQTAAYYLDGAVIDDLIIDTERAEIPVFATLRVGFQKFQQTEAFRVWVDEVALDSARIGCDR